MASLNESTLFTRTSESFILSQRFKRYCSILYGILKTVIQTLSANTLFQHAPRPFSYVFLFFYLFLLALLVNLLVTQVFFQQPQQYQDHGLFDMIFSPQKIIKTLKPSTVFMIAFAVFNYVFYLTICNEDLGEEYLYILIPLLFCGCICYGICVDGEEKNAC